MPAGAVGSCWATDSWSATVWEAGSWADAVIAAFVQDMNTRIMVYLRTFYGVSGGDLTTLTERYLREQLTGEYTARFQQLIDDASA